MRPKVKEDRGFSKKIPERHLGGRPEKEGVLLEQSINETVKELEVFRQRRHVYSVNRKKERQFDTQEKQKFVAEDYPCIKQKDKSS